MDTQTPTPPAVKPVNITEADVLAFFRTANAEIAARLTKLCARAGFEAPTLTINAFGGVRFDIMAWSGGAFVSAHGEGLAHAEAEFVRKMTRRCPDSANLRERASELIKQAERIEAAAGKEGV